MFTRQTQEVRSSTDQASNLIYPYSAKNAQSNRIRLDSKLSTLNTNLGVGKHSSDNDDIGEIIKTSSTTTNSGTQDKTFSFPTSGKNSSRTYGEEKSAYNRSMSTKRTSYEPKQHSQYYMASLAKHMKGYDSGDYFCKLFRDHFAQCYQAINFCKNLKPVDQKELAKKKVYIPKRDSHRGKCGVGMVGVMVICY